MDRSQSIKCMICLGFVLYEHVYMYVYVALPRLGKDKACLVKMKTVPTLYIIN